MDIKCRHCGEPWALDTLHEAATEYGDSFDDRARAFGTEGCSAIGATCIKGRQRHPELDAIGVLTDLLDGDPDGLAAALEDFGL